MGLKSLNKLIMLRKYKKIIKLVMKVVIVIFPLIQSLFSLCGFNVEETKTLLHFMFAVYQQKAAK